MKINFFSVNNFRGISGGLESNKITFENTNTLFISVIPHLILLFSVLDGDRPF